MVTADFHVSVKDTTSNFKHIVVADCHCLRLNSFCVWHDVLWIARDSIYEIRWESVMIT